MSISAAGATTIVGRHRKSIDRIGDPVLTLLTALASLAAVGLLVWILVKVTRDAQPAISQFGLGFITSQTWNPATNQFGAAAFIYGTVVGSRLALLAATPLSIAIALFLTELAPSGLRRPVAILVELLAAIPSVILGLWGILVLGPFLNSTLEPALHSVLGWIPLFGGTISPYGMFSAAMILTIMTVPIISAVMRELFETTPRELKEAAYALGATRWEMVRMVVLPHARPGMVGAVILGLGRALGEAIAVTQVIGNLPQIKAGLFEPAATLASQVASQYQGLNPGIPTASLVYLALILLMIAIAVNAAARVIVRRVSH